MIRGVSFTRKKSVMFRARTMSSLYSLNAYNVIMLRSPGNGHPGNSDFIRGKVGFTWVLINFLTTAQNIDLVYGYLLEPANHNLCLEQKY